MTRRSLFATLAAAIAGPKLAPAGPFSNAVSRPLSVSVEPLREALDEYSAVAALRGLRYTHVKYGVGFKVSRSMLEAEQWRPGKIFSLDDDALLHQAIYQAGFAAPPTPLKLKP